MGNISRRKFYTEKGGERIPKIIRFQGKAKCAWRVGKERAEENGLDGNCEECKYYETIGVHRFCNASTHLCAHVIAYDCAVTSIKSESDEKVRCLNCDTHLKPQTVRCSECLETKELKNFKPCKPGKSIYE